MATNSQVMKAVNFALMSTGAAGTMLTAPATLAQDEGASELEQIVVTGSRIRRVEAETASPVFTLDRNTIAESGVTTMGDLLQQIPSISGAATNPQVNNGGGTGASAVELRGLGTQRTLVLLNGRRLGNLENANLGADVNIIPTNLVERVDVLKEGAGAIYGSDAVGGVVNFVTRSDFDGLELNAEAGVSGQGDGDTSTVSLAWGSTGERGNVILSGTFQHVDSISSNDRKYTREAIYFYGEYIFAAGSSRVPTGRMYLPVTNPLAAQYGCTASQGQISVTRIEGTSGASPADYRCYSGSDSFNYQPYNLILTPQERTNLFAQGNYKVTDDIEAYAEVLWNYTTSGFEIAPLPFDSQSDTTVISADNVYNPFDIDFGAAPGAQPGDAPTFFQQATWRLLGLGTRHSKVDTNSNQITLGMKGGLPWGNWEWDASGTYSSVDQDSQIDGYLFKPLFSQALGPSFIASNGVPTCGTPTAPISNCTPLNPFNLESQESIDALNLISAGYHQNYSYTQQAAGLSFNGDLFDLPAGPIGTAIGFEYLSQSGKFDTDFNTQSAPPLFNVCQLSNETCSGDSQGNYDVRALYGEVLIPLLKDVTAFQALNLTLGVRYSDYSLFDSSTDSTIKLEWRPIGDLLVRGSYAEVFRVPTIYDLYQAPASSATQYNDPCVGLTAADLAANPNLALVCENVVPDGTFEQPNSQIDGLLMGNTVLTPETGEVTTFGFVYDPSWLPGLSINVDYWDYHLEDVITQLDVNTISDQCAETGDPTYCDLISRKTDGSIFQIQQPTANFGQLDTSGVDAGIRYLLRDTPAGDFRFSIDGTYIDKYDSVVVQGTDVIEVAGTYNRQYGNYADFRGIAAVGWALEPFNALISARYIAGLDLIDPNGAPGVQPPLAIPSATYIDLSVGATIMDSVKVQFSVDNITDEEPPLMYQNNVLNSNTDVSTYDLVGTFYRVSLNYKFQ
jgi:outer membrane receptor protein involved in Fe transport